MLSFVIGIISIFTGLMFTVLVTRQLSQEQFGLWSLIGGLLGYVYILRPIISFWATREIARGIETGRTAFFFNGFIAIFAILIYLGISYVYGIQTDIDLRILFFASLLIPVEFFRGLLVGITNAYKPHREEFGLIIFESTKIILGLFLIYFLNLGIEGVIITMVFAGLSSVIFLLVSTREKLRQKFNMNNVKKWLRLFWLPTYPNISSLLNSIDVTIFTLITGSVAGLAYWASARAVSRIVYHSSKIGKAVYPKLLSGGKKEYMQENIILVLYFSFPLSAMSMAFAKPGLFILNPEYEVAIFVVLFLTPTIFFRTLNEVFIRGLTGIEKVDTNETSSFIDYLKSKLFFLPTLRNIERGVYTSSLAILLLFLLPIVESELELVMYWAMAALVIQIPFTIYLYTMIKREFHPKIDRRKILTYFLISVFIFGISYILIEKYLVYNESLFEFLSNFIPFLLLSVGGYLGITYLVDSRTRKLFKAVIHEFKPK